MLRPRTQPGHRRARTLSRDSVAYNIFTAFYYFYGFRVRHVPEKFEVKGYGGEMTAALFTRMTQGYTASHALVLRYH